MNTTADIFKDDPRCGASWLAHLDSPARNQLLIALLSRFNHDLRTPLNTILGWTHLLQRGELDTARAKHISDVIARNSRDQTQLLEDFVDDQRAVLHVLRLQPADLQMDESVTFAIERAGSLFTLHGVSLESKLDTAGVLVNGDARRLARLTYRLLAIVVRRARESSSVDLKTRVEQGNYVLALSGTAYEPDWSDAALLDLRISTFVIALHRGELQVGADSTRPCIVLKLPCL